MKKKASRVHTDSQPRETKTTSDVARSSNVKAATSSSDSSSSETSSSTGNYNSSEEVIKDKEKVNKDKGTVVHDGKPVGTKVQTTATPKQNNVTEARSEQTEISSTVQQSLPFNTIQTVAEKKHKANADDDSTLDTCRSKKRGKKIFKFLSNEEQQSIKDEIKKNIYRRYKLLDSPALTSITRELMEHFDFPSDNIDVNADINFLARNKINNLCAYAKRNMKAMLLSKSCFVILLYFIHYSKLISILLLLFQKN